MVSCGLGQFGGQIALCLEATFIIVRCALIKVYQQGTSPRVVFGLSNFSYFDIQTVTHLTSHFEFCAMLIAISDDSQADVYLPCGLGTGIPTSRQP